MSMLAERRRKTKWVINPTKKPLWTQDSSGIKLGKELMEKMGWSPGKGLGLKEQGMQEPLKVSYKNDTKGMGFKGNDEDWIEHQDGFNSLLSELSNQCATAKATDIEKNEIKSLEEKSKQSRARVHYQKFTRGKDMSKYSENDLACILGTNKLKKQKQNQNMDEKVMEQDGYQTSFGVTTINSGSIEDYFKSKFNSSKKKTSEFSDVKSTHDEINEVQPNVEEGKSKKRKHDQENDCVTFNSVEELTASDGNKEKKKHKKKKVKDTSDINCDFMTEENRNETVTHSIEFEKKITFEDDYCDSNNSLINQDLSSVHNLTEARKGNTELQIEETSEENLKLKKKKKKLKEKDIEEVKICTDEKDKKKKGRKEESQKYCSTSVDPTKDDEDKNVENFLTEKADPVKEVCSEGIESVGKKKKKKRKKEELEKSSSAIPLDTVKDELESSLIEDENVINSSLTEETGPLEGASSKDVESLTKKKRKKKLEESSATPIDAVKDSKLEPNLIEDKKVRNVSLTESIDYAKEVCSEDVESLGKKKKKKRKKEVLEKSPATPVDTIQSDELKSNLIEDKNVINLSLTEKTDPVEACSEGVESLGKKKKRKRKREGSEGSLPATCNDTVKNELESNLIEDKKVENSSLTDSIDHTKEICEDEELLRKKKKKKSKDIEFEVFESDSVHNNKIVISEIVPVKKKKHDSLDVGLTKPLNTDSLLVEKEKKKKTEKLNPVENESLKESLSPESIDECKRKGKKRKKRHKEISNPDNEIFIKCNASENGIEDILVQGKKKEPVSNESSENCDKDSERTRLSKKENSELQTDSKESKKIENVIHSHKTELFKKRKPNILPNLQNYTNNRVLKLICGAEFEKFRGANVADISGYGPKKKKKPSKT